MREEAPFLLVTGGAGYIGSHTAAHLSAQGYRLIILDSLENGHREALPADADFIEGNLGDEALLEDLFSSRKIDCVLHFAAYAYVGDSVNEPLDYYRNNLSRPLALLDAMRRHDCRGFVFSSTCATYGVPEKMPIRETTPQNPVNPYGASKLMLERVLADCERAWGLRHVILRYFNASGCSSDGTLGEDHDPETHLIPRALMAALGEIPHLTIFGDDYPTPDGTCVRDYIHVEDLASAHALAVDRLRSGGASLACNLGTGVGVSIQELISAAERVTGRPIPLKWGPRREGDPPELVADASKARQELGWTPRHTNIESHLSTAWEWFSGRRRYRS